MLSFSLRRKSAPGSLNVRNGTPSPVKQSGSTIPSVSSKKSLSSLFSLGTKDGSPRTSKPADEVDILEKDVYPAYDPTNPDHTGSANSPLKTSKRSTRSSSRNRSASTNGTFLEALASKMRAATEFFHKSASKTNDIDKEPDSHPQSRSVSPKKAVRFRSSISSNGDAKSSPINVPGKSAPSLPRLDLTKSAFGNDLDEVGTTPIPTGRPPNTPMLKGKEADSYFPRQIEPTSFLDLPHTMGNLTLEPAQTPMDKADKNPFGDDAAIVEHPRQKSPNPSTASFVGTDSINERKLRDTKSSSEKSHQTAATVWDESSGDRQNSVNAKEVPQKTDIFASDPISIANPDGTGENYVPPSAQVSYAVVNAPPLPSATDVTMADATNKATEKTIWTLESRELPGDRSQNCTSDSDDMDLSPSASAIPHRSTPRKPTHEDIRRQFRNSRSRPPPGLREASSSSIGCGVECDASFLELPNESERTCSAGGVKHSSAECTHETFDEKTLSGIVISSRASSPTDPQKPLPPQATTPKLSVPEQAVVVPEDTVSPLNLKANVSSTSPSRTRRPFRFSNSADKDQTSPIGNTSFSWHAKDSKDDIKATTEFQNQTPSPVSIPLPLSIAPKRFGLPHSIGRYVDQHGWSPFDEKHFPDVLLNASHLHHLFNVEGGFAAFWEICELPKGTKPSGDTRRLMSDETKEMIAQATRIRGLVESPESVKKKMSSNVMDKMFSPWVGGNFNKFSLLAGHQKDYSGEVSSVDMPMTDEHPEAGNVACSDIGCDMCMTRESYESNIDPSIPESVSGYVSDTEINDQENLASSIHTPTRLPRPTSGDRTPTQTDFGRTRVQALARSSPKRQRFLQGSESTVNTFNTGAYMSEDEKFAKGII